MLNHPTLEKLQQLRLLGMAKAFREQMEQPEASDIPFEDRLALMVDREAWLHPPGRCRDDTQDRE